jgi:HSP20 family protein
MFGLERWNPTRQTSRPAVDQMVSRFDDMVSRFFDEPFFNGMGAQTWTPSADIVETDDHLKIYLDLPGMRKEDLDIQLVNANTLVVRGDRKFEQQEDNKYLRLERFSGSFSRSFVLTSSVDADKVDASFKEGVLEIILPKTESAKSRRIAIHS